MSRSHRANRYGTLAEKRAAEKYRLRRAGEHTSWCDAVEQDGTPVEIKSAMAERPSGTQGRFRVFEEYHNRLHAAGGKYVFVAYRPRGAGITVLGMKMLPASRLPVITWYGAGGHRDSQQTKISIDAVM